MTFADTSLSEHHSIVGPLSLLNTGKNYIRPLDPATHTHIHPPQRAKSSELEAQHEARYRIPRRLRPAAQTRCPDRSIALATGPAAGASRNDLDVCASQKDHRHHPRLQIARASVSEPPDPRGDPEDVLPLEHTAGSSSLSDYATRS